MATRRTALAAALLFASGVRAADAPAAEAPPKGMAELRGQVKLTSASLLGEAEVRGADVLVYLAGELPAPRRRKGAPLPKMVQRDKAFQPGLLVVQVGDTVLFPNEDTVFHNVFSLTEGNQFDLGIYSQGSSKAVRFGHPGVVDVFCNIHPQMIGAIVVVENPYHARAGADGRWRLVVPPGRHKVAVYWTRGVREEREVEVAAGQVLDLDFALKDTGQKVRHLDKDGQSYGRYK